MCTAGSRDTAARLAAATSSSQKLHSRGHSFAANGAFTAIPGLYGSSKLAAYASPTVFDLLCHERQPSIPAGTAAVRDNEVEVVTDSDSAFETCMLHVLECAALPACRLS